MQIKFSSEIASGVLLKACTEDFKDFTQNIIHSKTDVMKIMTQDQALADVYFSKSAQKDLIKSLFGLQPDFTTKRGAISWLSPL